MAIPIKFARVYAQRCRRMGTSMPPSQSLKPQIRTSNDGSAKKLNFLRVPSLDEPNQRRYYEPQTNYTLIATRAFFE